MGDGVFKTTVTEAFLFIILKRLKHFKSLLSLFGSYLGTEWVKGKTPTSHHSHIFQQYLCWLCVTNQGLLFNTSSAAKVI